MIKIADRIEYEGDNSTFVWKHPLEDFNTMTQLIVHESQEAIFFMNGQALDTISIPGRYPLETENIPLLGKLLKIATGGETPFHCEVYFINKTEQMAVKWGTDTKVQYIEPRYNFPLSIGACGEMSLRVSDGRKLLLKLVGTENYLSQARLVDYFRGILMTKIKTYIAKTMREKEISIFSIDENLMTFSEDLKKMLAPDFEEYGVALEKFFVLSVLKPDGEPQYEKFRELFFRKYADIEEARINQKTELIRAQTGAQVTIIDSEGQKVRRENEKMSAEKEHIYKILGKLAENEGTGADIRNSTIGLGVGFGVGGPLGTAFNSLASSAMSGMMENPNSLDKPFNDQLSGEGFPGMITLKDDAEDPKDVEDEMAEFKKKLEKLKMARDMGLLDEEEFNQKKEKLLEKL